MSNFDQNPFADPRDVNPFSGPNRSQPQQNRGAFDDDFNPFADPIAPTQPPQQPRAAPAAAMPPPQPAVMTASDQPPPYSPTAAQLAADDLQRKQEELERKAAELQRKEQELQKQSAQYGNRQNNFPPLPAWFPMQPCCFQDFSIDIPLEFQRTVKMAYYLWLAYTVLLLLNTIGALAFACVESAGWVTFGVSLIYIVIFIPCSFVCWFRPVYKAFRSDSSFNFFLFFFIFFFQFCVTVLFAVGIPGWGSCGFLTIFRALGKNKPVAFMMIIIASLFILMAVAIFLFMVQVHRIYRQSGASFQKAQEEFAQGVWTNKTVQHTATNVGSAAVRGAMNNQGGGGGNGNRY